MFVEVQKLELFPGPKFVRFEANSRLIGLQTLNYNGVAHKDGFDATFLANLSLDRLSGQFECFNFGASGTNSRLIAQQLR